MSIAGIVGLEDLPRICPLISRRVQSPWRRGNRELSASGTVHLAALGPVVIAGPCAVENCEQTLAVARAVKAAGANMLRGGAFKPRTSPHDFQGLGLDGLRILREASQETGLPVVTEVMDPRLVGTVSEYADMLQIGSRNMQNYPLLIEAGKSGKPVLLKRGMAASSLRVAWSSGIHRQGRKLGHRAVRARHQGLSLRRIFAQRSRLERHSGREGGNISAGDRRSQPCHGRFHYGRAGQLRGNRIRQPWTDHRGRLATIPAPQNPDAMRHKPFLLPR